VWQLAGLGVTGLIRERLRCLFLPALHANFPSSSNISLAISDDPPNSHVNLLYTPTSTVRSSRVINMNKNWTDKADRDLFFTILSVKNIGVISGSEWATIGTHMRSLGYGFTNEGCR
jgi:hypothetical protein